MKIPRVSLEFHRERAFHRNAVWSSERKERTNTSILSPRGANSPIRFSQMARNKNPLAQNRRFSHRHRTIRAVARGPTHPTRASRLL